MNRLILLGNGFDLAHGLRTSYNDFILWYLASSMDKAQKDLRYDDEIITITSDYWKSPFAASSIMIVNELYRTGCLAQLFSQDTFTYELNGFQYSLNQKFIVHTEFMKSLFDDCSVNNWVDIENKYYHALKQILDMRSSGNEEADHLLQLNKTMEVLTKNLQRYLKTQKTRNVNPGYDRIFNHEIKEEEFVHWDKIENYSLEKTLILNFNYTATVENYSLRNKTTKDDIPVNYIHGQLNFSENPMIFGFGDELDANYKRIEEHPTKGIFKHIKSFGYFKTRNYHNLIRYIESGQYQVSILGHSCGLSDRTMLNMIFEHDNCMSIKIYYHQNSEGVNNYTELTEEISRHFKSKTKMRERIVTFEDSSRMPQVE